MRWSRGWILHPLEFHEGSEGELEPELYVAGASRSEDRIAVHDIGRRAPAAECLRNRRIVAESGVNHPAVRIGENGVIKHVKELDAELSAVAFLDREGLEYREIHIHDAWVVEHVPRHRAIGSRFGRKHQRPTVLGHVAAAGGER